MEWKAVTSHDTQIENSHDDHILFYSAISLATK
jgi:hypothetical protein